jgi:type IV pilus assembly protein PilC
MPFFDYIAINSDQEEIEGVVEAQSNEDALDILTGQGFTILSINRKQEGRNFSININFFQRVKNKDLVMFTRQFSVMISATLPIVQALRILVNQTKTPFFKIVISELVDDVDGGAALSESLAKHPEVFSKFYISMVKSGETSGKLEEILNYLADQQEKDYDFVNKVKGAMIYPVFILLSLVGVGFVMMVFVIPKLTEVLQEAGGELPVATRILIGSSHFLNSFWWLFVIIGLGGFFGFRYYRKTQIGKKHTDFIALKIPIFGPLIFQKMYIVRFSRSLSTLLTGGVSLTEALQITSDIVGNEVYRDIIQRTIDEVEDGNSIATAFSESSIVPFMVSQMLAVGEQTGKIDIILNKISDFYSREVDTSVNNLVTIIEPVILLVMGVAVGILVAAILLPMYSMAV